MQGLAPGPAEDEIVIRPSGTDEEPTLVLGRPVPAEDAHRLRIEFDAAPALVRLRSVGEVERVVDRHELAAHVQHRRVEVDIGPSKTADLPSTHAGQRSKAEKRKEVLVLDL